MMKICIKLISVVVLCLCVVTGTAQNRSIEFRTGEWKKVLRMAKREKKLIFMDCYTSWCGPCKMLAKRVFTDDAVADFYNARFVCVKMDMEKGEGPELARIYKVGAYPALLYIDAQGQLKHAVSGYMLPDELLRQGNIALEGKKTLERLSARYDAGEREDAFVREYMEVLFRASQERRQKAVATEYVSRLDDRSFYTRQTWDILNKNLSDPLSPILKKANATMFRFMNFVSRDTVEAYFDYTLRSAVSAFVWHNPKKSPFNRQRYEELLRYIPTVELPTVPQHMATLFVVKYAEKGDIKGMLEEMKRSICYGIFYNNDAKIRFFQNFMRHIEGSRDKDCMLEADAMLQQAVQDAASGYCKSEFMLLRARLMRAAGEPGRAVELEKAAENVRMM